MNDQLFRTLSRQQDEAASAVDNLQKLLLTAEAADMASDCLVLLAKAEQATMDHAATGDMPEWQAKTCNDFLSMAAEMRGDVQRYL